MKIIMKYYAVKNGRVPGIYTSWAECQKQVTGYSSAVFKSFTSKQAALEFLGASTADDNAETPETQQTVTTDTVSTAAWAYVDGSYVHKQKRYSYGMVICTDDGEEYSECRAFDGADNEEMAKMRNVAGEIAGSMRAAEYCIEHNIPSVTIFYDYEGIERWANGEWKTNKVETKEYAEYIKKARENITIVFQKVKGHSGDKYNDMVDALAKSALGL